MRERGRSFFSFFLLRAAWGEGRAARPDACLRSISLTLNAASSFSASGRDDAMAVVVAAGAGSRRGAMVEETGGEGRGRTVGRGG